MKNPVMTTLLLVLLFQSCVTFHISDYRDVAVIGGGVGGLVTSALLSKSGLNVLLIEKNEKCGGRMNSEHIIDPIHNATYRFDVGPSLLLLPDVYKETFELLGSKIEDHVELLKVDPFYRCYFEEDGTFAEISNNEEKMKSVANSIETDGYKNFVDYLKTASDFLRFGLPAVIQERPEYQHFGSFLIACLKVFPLLSHDSMLKKYFKTSKMRAMMSFQDLYIGLSPYESPAIFSLLQALELERGIYYPKGGFASVANALQLIAENVGVDIVTKCTIEEVELSTDDDNYAEYGNIKEKRMKSIKYSTQQSTQSTQSIQKSELIATSNINIKTNENEKKEFNSHKITAKTFITNIDAPEFDKMLVPVPQKDKRTISGVPSCGIISLNFAFNTTLQCLSHHTLFLSKSYKNSWNVVDQPDNASFNQKEFNFYVHCPSRTDSTVCPIGHDAVTILVPVPPLSKSNINNNNNNDSNNNDNNNNNNSNNDCDNREVVDISIIRNAVLKQLQIMENSISNNSICITNHIVMEKIREPKGWNEDFGLFRGSAFGLAHSIDQLSLLRPRLRHPKIKNLFRLFSFILLYSFFTLFLLVILFYCIILFIFLLIFFKPYFIVLNFCIYIDYIFIFLFLLHMSL